jgi:glutathione S-transferase
MLKLLWQRLRHPRTEEEKSRLQAQTEALSLYHYPACPYCHKVRLAIALLELRIKQKDTVTNSRYHQELSQEGGKKQVPCLRIGQQRAPDLWLYESDAIIEYLAQRFPPQSSS